jgi:hypothetical protein
MSEALSKLSNDDILAICGMLVGVIAILSGISVAVTAVVLYHRRKSNLAEMETTLKLEMLERGMSASEIKEVLEAKLPGNQSTMEEFANRRERFFKHGWAARSCGKA